MKVLIDVRTLGKQPSGVGIYIYRLAQGLSRQEGIEVILATDVAESSEILQLIEQDKVETHTYGQPVGKGPSVWRYAAFLEGLIGEVRPDIFWEPNNLLPVRLNNPYGKYVATIHDIFPVTMPECYGRIYPPYFQYGIRKTLSSCDGILYISDAMRKEIEKYFPLAASKKHLVGYIIVPPITQQIEKKNYFYYVGNLEQRKGTDLLLAAYEKYLAASGSRDLYLAGKVREDRIQKQLDVLKAKTDKVHCLGYIDEAEKERRYAECGIFVFPSRAEGFGIPVIEALSCGTDVLASDLPVFRELAGDVLQYFELEKDVVSSVDNLSKAMLAAEVRDNDEDARKQCAERYTEEHILPDVITFFEELIA